MLNYISSEHLKQRHTFTRKMVWIAPVVTLLISILSPIWYQQNSYNWWYILLYPGFLTLVCILVNQKDGGNLKYRAIYPLPINLEKFWYAKIALCTIYAVIANIILMVCNILGGFIIFQVYKIPMSITVIQAIVGTIFIILASVWNIPLCLWLTKKFGAFATLIVNVGFSFVLGALGASTDFWIACPYSWASRLMVPTLGILPNGEPATAMNLPVPLAFTIVALLLSFMLLCLLSKVTAKSFKKQEVR